MNPVEIKKLKCKRCEYEWWPRPPDFKEPGTCANEECRSKYWKTKRVRYSKKHPNW